MRWRPISVSKAQEATGCFMVQLWGELRWSGEDGEKQRQTGPTDDPITVLTTLPTLVAKVN